MRQISILVLSVSCLALSAAPDSAEAVAKVHPSLAGAIGKETGVIIRFAHAPDARMHAAIRRQGGTLLRDLPIIDSAAYRVPNAALSKLASLREVVRISPDETVRPAMDVTAATVGATTAWSTYGATGKNIGIAVIDSGVTYQADLNDASGHSRVVYSQFFRADTTTEDLAGHGTHVAGIIAGRGNNSTGSSYSRTFKGIAPDAKIVNLAVLDRYNNGKDSDVIAAIQKAIDLKATYNIRVINLSVGRPVSQSYKTDPLCQAVEKPGARASS